LFWVKIHRTEKDTVLAVCDEELIGKKFEEGDLSLHVSETFYRGEKMGSDVIELFDHATIINLVGEKIVRLSIEKGWVSEDGVIKISGIPHAQVIKI